MPKFFTIKSTHRNAILALRHAGRLRSEFNADVSFTRHDQSGKFSKRGQQYIFKIIPRHKKMWRIIVGFPYLVNKKKGQSPDARTMKAVYYGRTKQDVVQEKARLRRAAHHEIKKVDKAWIQDNKKHTLYRRVNVTVSQVEYDNRFVGITEFLDD